MRTTLLCLFCICFYSATGQRSISISLFSEATAIPFTSIPISPIHPGIQIGTDFTYRQTKSQRLFQTAQVSYFYHQHLSQGISLTSEIAKEFRLKKGLALQGMLGIGYTHTFATQPEFTHSPDGYLLKRDRGNARISPSFSLQIGYYFNDTADSPKVFLQYQSWVEYPYSPGFIPIMTHVNLHVGYRFFINNTIHE